MKMPLVLLILVGLLSTPVLAQDSGGTSNNDAPEKPEAQPTSVKPTSAATPAVEQSKEIEPATNAQAGQESAQKLSGAQAVEKADTKAKAKPCTKAKAKPSTKANAKPCTKAKAKPCTKN